MLTSKVKSRIDLPHEPGEWIEARMPSAIILDQARQMHTASAIKLTAGVDRETLALLTASAPTTNGATVQRAIRDEYDQITLLRACITAWSYPEPVTPDLIGDLDEQTVNVVLAALLPREPEAERKNASGRSTKH